MAPANNNYSTPPPKAKKAAIGGLGKKVELSSQQVPNSRFTQAFQEMKEVCPNSISIYMHPVYLKQNDQDNLYPNIHVPKNLDL